MVAATIGAKVSQRQRFWGPVPPPPSFAEPITEVRDRVRTLVGKVSIPKTFNKIHPLISRLLEEDERRREKQRTSSYAFSWDAPLFDAPFERRRLRIMNNLFLAVANAGAKPSIRGREAQELGITIGEQHVSFALNRVSERGRRTRAEVSPEKPGVEKLNLHIKTSLGSDHVRIAWQDGDAGPIERQLQDIAVELVVYGEIQYRESCELHHQWRITRRAQLEEEIRQRQKEAERQERARKIKLEKARIDRLLREASALRQANEIRAYVDAVRSANAISRDPVPQVELDIWVAWALAQANRIDPIATGAFRKLSSVELGVGPEEL